MSITGAIVIFVMVWWMVFFAMLPLGVRGQAEMNEVAPGTEPGAPVKPDLKRKALWTTAIAAPITAAIEIAIALGWLGPFFSTGR
jgi:predicted secreted protein